MLTRKAVLKKLQVRAALAEMPDEVREIISAVCDRLSLPEEKGDMAGSMSGVAYVTQYVNWLSKTVNKGFYELKNILTRWLAENNPDAYYDGESILYVPVDDGKQLSFHVHRDREGADSYSVAHGNEVEWDEISRQPMAEVYLINFLGAGDEDTIRMEQENEL
jgi:hypothetical protein